jgi:putative MFS transporter
MARASGLGQAVNGVGKILGPLSLALIAGSSNVVSPQATFDTVLPAYLFLAFCVLLVGLFFVFLAVETHGKAMGIGGEEPTVPPSTIALGTEAR